jgi:hypothetical protein
MATVVYLAGKMTGLPVKSASQWRIKAAQELGRDLDFAVLSVNSPIGAWVRQTLKLWTYTTAWKHIFECGERLGLMWVRLFR